mmetsp:Transcript_13935/g.40823  ORF Transcript_13935/g.40823 Transcript_13935/m.40823 type:complete len:131 (-) Transcript_13935:535-927(-)
MMRVLPNGRRGGEPFEPSKSLEEMAMPPPPAMRLVMNGREGSVPFQPSQAAVERLTLPLEELDRPVPAVGSLMTRLRSYIAAEGLSISLDGMDEDEVLGMDMLLAESMGWPRGEAATLLAKVAELTKSLQ